MENKSERYARQLRVTIGDMFHWKSRPSFKVRHDFSPIRSLSIEVEDIRRNHRAFDFRKFADKLEESGWEVIRMIPTFRDDELDIGLKTPIMQFWVRKVEEVDLLSSPIDNMELIRKPSRFEVRELKSAECSCQGYGEDSCISHSKEPPMVSTV